MGHPIINVRPGALIVKINKEGYTKLVALARTVVLRMTAAVAIFATPNPAMAALTAAADALETAATKMGHKRNRGSKADLEAAKAAATTLRNLLTAELAYVIKIGLKNEPTDATAFAALIVQSGFSMKNVKSITPKPQVATFARRTNNMLVGSEPQLKWRKPKGLLKGKQIAGYNIRNGAKPVSPADVDPILATTTATKWEPKGLSKGSHTYRIFPFNSRGEGTPLFVSLTVI